MESEQGNGSGTSPASVPRYRFLNAEFDTATRILSVDGREHALPPKLFGLLHLLATSGGRTVTKEEIIDRVWDGAFVSEGAINQLVARLRKILGTSRGDQRFIATVAGVGYRLVPSVEQLQNATTASTSRTPVFRKPGLASPWARSAIGLAIVVLVLALTALQPDRRGEGFLREYGTEQPIANARIVFTEVRWEGTEDPQRIVTDTYSTTDESGRFRIDGATPGTVYGVSPEAEGFELLTAASLYYVAPAATILVTEDGRLEPSSIYMSPIRTQVVSGSVLDSEGQPVRARVSAYRLAYEGGRRIDTLPAGRGGGLPDGAYEFALDPGEYMFQAVPLAANPPRLTPQPASSPVFYPGVFDPDQSEPVIVRSGVSERGVDIVIPELQGYTVRLSTTSDTVEVASIGLDLPGTGLTDPTRFTLQDDGSFLSTEVQPGRYLLTIRTRAPGSGSFDTSGRGAVMKWVDMVDSHLNLGTIDLDANTLSVSGRIAGVDLSRLVQAETSIVLRVLGMVHPVDFSEQTGEFTVEDVAGGLYVIDVANLPESISLSSLRLDGIDLWTGTKALREGVRVDGPLTVGLGTGEVLFSSDAPNRLEINLSEGALVVEGMVYNSEGEVQSQAHVILIPEGASDAEPIRLWTGDADLTGRFSIPHVPPGAYRIYAYAYAITGDPSPERLRELESELEPIVIGPENAAMIEAQTQDR